MQTNAATLEAQMPAPRQDEVTAAQLALHGTLWQRLGLSAKALFNLMRNPDDTGQVFVMGLAMNAHRFPWMMARFVADESGGRLLREQPSIDSKGVDFAWLRSLPADTLGGAFARHLAANNLDPDVFQAPPGLPTTVAYIAKRVRQTHDLWHLVTGYGTDVAGEIALQAFYYGQMHTPSAGAIALGGTAKYVVETGDFHQIARVREGYRRGKQATFLSNVYWEDMWTLPLEEVRTRLGVGGTGST